MQFLVLDLFCNGRHSKYFINFCSACEKTFLLLRGNSMIFSHGNACGKEGCPQEKKFDNDKLDQPFPSSLFGFGKTACAMS